MFKYVKCVVLITHIKSSSSRKKIQCFIYHNSNQIKKGEMGQRK